MKMKINMNIRNAFGRLCIPILALGVFSASCTDELSSEVVPGGGGKGGESEVTLKLQVPGTDAGAKTRAVTPEEENVIDDLYVLAFKMNKDNNAETFDYYVAAKKNTEDASAGKSTWTASLKVKDYQQTFVMIANAQGTTRKVNEQISALARNSVGQGKMEMLAKLTETLSEDEKTKGFNADAPGNHRPFTMYGQTAAILITENGGHNLTVSMHRIMAQVRITFTGDAANDTKFEAESVLLYNFNDRARVIPDNLRMTGKDYVKTPTIPQGAVLLPAKADGKEKVPTYEVDAADKKIAHAIYLFETAQPETGTDLEKHVKRPCLIVKGKHRQEANSCYYRVDLATTDAGGAMTYMNVLRNHSYNVTISNVTGRGHDTPQEALLSKQADITATVVAWDDTEMGDIDFDGQRVLGIGTMKYQLGKRGGNDLLQQVKASKGLAWTATLYAMDDYGQATTNNPDWIKFVGTDRKETQTISGVGTNQLEDWKFNVKKNDVVAERRAVMRFTAGNLKVDALVVQDQSNPVYINVKINGKVITEVEFKQLGGWCDKMTIEYGPENTELAWKYTGRGVVLDNIRANGAETTEKEDAVSSGGVENATLTWEGHATGLTSALDYVTQDGVLTLIAKGKQGMEAKSIRLFQKKYGVTLESSMVTCNGQVQHIYVKGNMPWKATMNTDDLNNVMDKNMLQTTYTSDSGEATDTNSNPFSRLTFKTKKADMKTGLLDATMTFQHPEKQDIGPIEKRIRFAGLFEYGGQNYVVLGPIGRTLNEITSKKKYTYPDGTEDAGAFMANAGQANSLTMAGLDDWEVCSNSSLEDINFFTHKISTDLDNASNIQLLSWIEGHNDETWIILNRDNVIVYYGNALRITNYNLHKNGNTDYKYVYYNNYGSLSIDLPSIGSQWHKWDCAKLYHYGNNLINVKGGSWGQINCTWYGNPQINNKITLGGYPVDPAGLPTFARNNARHEAMTVRLQMYTTKDCYINLQAGPGYDNYSWREYGNADKDTHRKQPYKIYYLKPVY